MRSFHEMTRQEAHDYLLALYFAQPTADWNTLKEGNVIVNKGRAWRITHIPPKRGFLMATNLRTAKAEKLLRSKYDNDDLHLTDEPTLATLRTVHREEIKKAMASGITISLQVQYDYPDIFTPYPESWDEKRREKAHELWRRINELRAYHERQGPLGWQFGKVDALKADLERDIASWQEYRAEVEAGVNIKKEKPFPASLAA